MVLIKSLDFAVVLSKKSDDTGLERGDTVMVLGDRMVPASSSDPYLFRKLVVLAKVVDDIPQVPGEDNEYKAMLFDPRKLEKVSDAEQERLVALISERRSV